MLIIGSSNAGDAGSILAQGTKIPRAMQYGQKNYILKKCDRTMYEKKIGFTEGLKRKKLMEMFTVFIDFKRCGE